MKKVRCSCCDEEFEITDTRFYSAKNRGGKIFCSIECRRKDKHCYRHIPRKCQNCGIEFLPKELNSKFCSLSCSAKYNNKKRKKTLVKPNKEKNKAKTCPVCGNVFESKKYKKICCSDECAAKARIEGGKKGGRISAANRCTRSKNEIYFAKLCKEKYDDTICNIPMFNGWDADVIIPSLKTAILWNGKWHYEKITKNHSIKQVQTRDKIKAEEIKKFGFNLYVIKDLGKYNKRFVENEFEKFITEHK